MDTYRRLRSEGFFLFGTYPIDALGSRTRKAKMSLDAAGLKIIDYLLSLSRD